MILLLGASGYVGRTFASELRRRGQPFIPLTRRAFDYSRFDFLFDYLRTIRPQFLVNAASFESLNPGAPSQAEKDRMIEANAILPQMIARVCLMTKTPWGHVSSGSIFRGAKVMENGELAVRSLEKPETLELFELHPERFLGFTELDEPNLSFKSDACNFYSGTKALAEESIKDVGENYIWRFRLPFNEREESCNWLWQMQRHGEVADSIHSLSHLEDCVKACLDLWAIRAPFGIYNLTNPGAASTDVLARDMHRILRRPVRAGAEENNSMPPGCILDSSKLLHTGVKLRSVNEALEDSLDRLRVSDRANRLVLLPHEAIEAHL